MTAIIKIKPGREKPIKQQHPWIFSGAIGSVKGNPAQGDVVTVVDNDGGFLARGYWNPTSQIQVRLLSWHDETIDRDWWHRKITQALELRRTVAAQTNAYRLINGENDFLPGLIVDRYGDYLVLQALSFGIEVQKWQITEMLAQLLEPKGIIERSDADVRAKEGLFSASGVLFGQAPPGPVEINEGVRLLVDLQEGQKTGFYLDQRPNRQLGFDLASQYAGDCAFLNLFSYTGGFALQGLRCEGVSAVNVDSSGQALALARQAVDLNGFSEERSTYHQADVFKWLREQVREKAQYDIVVLDPPKFAQSKHQVEGACRGYKDLNLQAFKLVRRGGYLMTFSCSGAISPDLFQKVVFSALADSGRQAQVLRHLGPGIDHPVALTFPEGAYLKGLLLRVL